MERREPEQQTLSGTEELVTLRVPFRSAMDAVDRELCVVALRRGSMVIAARLLGITRHAMKRRILKYALPYPLAHDFALEAPAGDSIEITVPLLAGIKHAERTLCIEALARCGSIVDAASLLGITRHAFKRRCIKYRIAYRGSEVLSENAS